MDRYAAFRKLWAEDLKDQELMRKEAQRALALAWFLDGWTTAIKNGQVLQIELQEVTKLKSEIEGLRRAYNSVVNRYNGLIQTG